ncbi:NAD(P)-dependent dehydrogenase (short-subunit alcohol dehydrogenase family) [Kribbella sp. VKM Ac-2569]|uniref:SDR family NAD(P)-dependent oxidoreductase n=1 Tax=Kribbella sp. VKM Ac-2569 TaxID=2512220 RepID=UPI0010ED5250|nr:SDR family NAD(P)-dependent oxidoreductase [Kribbella sp. VKM Ac-2569]RZT27690.1 NAD(P)-dependent dehydrogenase (short-subunit alcohol dehydrogenase family) [Kribbella sp. VKM Ac-2569]
MTPLRRILVWISGASAGLGAALAATIPFESVELIDISRRGGTPGTQHVAVDLADPESWPVVEKDFRQRIEAGDPQLVVFIHNAGTLTPLGSADHVDTEQYTRNVLLNSAAAQVLGQSFLSAVSGRDCEQHLIMVSSGAASRPHEGESSYCAGKAAIDQWVRTVGLEQQRRSPGCRVISVSPGSVDTDMQAELRAASPDEVPVSARFREMQALGHLAKPETVARTIWSLLDRDLPSGTVLHVRDVT